MGNVCVVVRRIIAGLGGNTGPRCRREKSMRVRVACCWYMGGEARQEGGEDSFDIYGHDIRDAESTELRRREDKVRSAPLRTASADAERVLHPSCGKATCFSEDAPDGHSTLDRENEATA